jgi:hypothetical protein
MPLHPSSVPTYPLSLVIHLMLMQYWLSKMDQVPLPRTKLEVVCATNVPSSRFVHVCMYPSAERRVTAEPLTRWAAPQRP